MDIDRVDALREGYRIFTSTSFQAASGSAFQELQFDTSPAPVPVISARAPGQRQRQLPPPVEDHRRSARMRSRALPSAPQLQFASTNPHAAFAASAPPAYVGAAIDPTVSAAAKVLFSPQGNFVQELVLEEAVNIADALSRSIVSSAIASVTKNPIAAGSVILRNAIVGGTAAILPPVLKPVGNGLLKMSPFYPFSMAVQELEGVFHLREEDIESLRILKRLMQVRPRAPVLLSCDFHTHRPTPAVVQILAGVDPSDPHRGTIAAASATGDAKLIHAHALGAGGVDKASTGLIEAEDLALVQQVLAQFSSQIRPGQWPAQALKIVGPGGKDVGNESDNLRAQLRQLLPLIRDIVPGATTLAIRFGRRLVGRSLGRLAERLEGVNKEHLMTTDDEAGGAPDPTPAAGAADSGSPRKK